jgi:hypothetical protein
VAVCERGVERCGRRPSAGAVATEAAIGSRRGRASRASSGIRRYFMLLPRTTSSGSFQKRSPSREVQITSRRQMFIQLSQLTRWPLYVSPFLSSTSIGCPCDVRRSESGSTIPPPGGAAPSLCARRGINDGTALANSARSVGTGTIPCVGPRHGATIISTTTSTAGAAAGRLDGRTVRSCRGCGDPVLGMCTPGEVKGRRHLKSGDRTRPYSRPHARMHAQLPLSPRHESGRRHAGRGCAPC